MLTAGRTPESVFWGTNSAQIEGAAGQKPAAPVGMDVTRRYSIVMLPSCFGRVPNDQLPTVSVTPLAVRLPLSGRLVSGAVPSPMSILAVPLKVIVPPLTLAVVIQPLTVSCWNSPRRGCTPLRFASMSPGPAVRRPRPNVPPESSTPLMFGVIVYAPEPAAVAIVSPTTAASPRTWMLPLRSVPPSAAVQSGTGPPPT